MRLKRLELLGFKSFAERTVLDFSRAVVGIVGPNGCGKSNVVDAVRWVLGEQRPTSMRGGEMSDVIFKGSASRPALSIAEVSLVLDNSDDVLEGRGAEVSVTRRVYRTGEGEYLIDGEVVRLKDLREMLFGTGLGSRGYSVLEQGKIDAILSANPVERRAIFEEAAGISRYRQRKKEAESRLKRVEADLLRLEDVVGELEKQRRSLKIQAGKAQRYVEARDAWFVDGLRYARHRAFVLTAEIGEAAARLTQCETEAEALRERRVRVEADALTRAQEQEALSAELERASAESAELGGEVRAIDERRAQLSVRIDSWLEESGDEAARAGELERKLGERRGERDGLNQEVEAFAEQAREAQERTAVLARQVAALADDFAAMATRVEEQNEAVLRSLHRRTSEHNHIDHLEGSLDTLGERLQRAEERRGELHGQVEVIAADEGRLSDAVAGRERALAGLETERAALEEELARSADRAGELDARRTALELEQARLGTRIEALLDWEREREGLESGAQTLLDAGGEGPRPGAEIRGLLADHLRTDTTWARALDAALGTRAQSLVVASAADARLVVEWLREKRSGRVSLAFLQLPPDRVPVHPLPSGLAAHPAVEGPLLEVVEHDAELDELAGFLLADVVRVADRDAAVALIERYPSWRFVTREGDLIGAAGLTGGHVEVTHGPVGRRSSAAALESERGATQTELAAVTDELSLLRSGRDASGARLRGLLGRIETEAEARHAERGELESARARLEELSRSAQLAERECATLLTEKEEWQAELLSARERLADAERATEEARARLSELEDQRRALEAERNQRARDEGQARVEATGFEERLQARIRRRADLERGIGELQAELERASRRSTEAAEQADEGRRTLEELASERDSLLERRGDLEERIATLRQREREGRDSVDVLRRDTEAITGELEAVMARVSEERLRQQRLDLSLDELRRRAEEDFGKSPVELLEGFAPRGRASPRPKPWRPSKRRCAI